MRCRMVRGVGWLEARWCTYVHLVHLSFKFKPRLTYPILFGDVLGVSNEVSSG
jgi:hypothetical protein